MSRFVSLLIAYAHAQAAPDLIGAGLKSIQNWKYGRFVWNMDISQASGFDVNLALSDISDPTSVTMEH